MNGSALDISRNHDGIVVDKKGSLLGGRSSDGEQPDPAPKQRNGKKRIFNGTQNIDKLEKM